MILKWIVTLGCGVLIIYCIRLMMQSAKQIDTAEEVPEGLAEQLEQPRSKLIKRVGELEEENEALRKKISELEGK